jgi:formylglycine-generating enzyme required for sulfatase activity
MTILNTPRLLRGGSWLNYPRYRRSAHRSRGLPDDANFYLGFRVVCLPREASTARHYSSMRGGSWFNYPWDCRLVCRGISRPDYAEDDIGFRVICLPPS